MDPQTTVIVQHNVIEVLMHWMRAYPTDFESELLREVMRFVREIRDLGEDPVEASVERPDPETRKVNP